MDTLEMACLLEGHVTEGETVHSGNVPKLVGL